MSYQKELKEMFETEKQHNQTTGVIIHDIIIDEDSVVTDVKTNCWRTLVELYVSESDPLPDRPEPEPFWILFEIYLPAIEKSFGDDEVVLRADLKVSVNYFKKCLKKYAVVYNVITKTTVDNWIKLGLKNYEKDGKVSILKSPCQIFN